MAKILVVGASGLVGSRFVELYKEKENLLTPSSTEMDITSTKSVEKYFDKYTPDAVINFASYTNVGESEKDRGDKNSLCWKVNVEGAKNIATKVKENNIFLIHISTDYVFPATVDDPGPYDESHAPETKSKKLTWYGYTKAEAERQIKDILNDNFAIVRIAYPFRSKFDKKLDYIRKPLSLFEQGSLYPMFNDQQLSITFIDDLCDALNVIIASKTNGIFHVCSTDIGTPFDIIGYAIEKKKGVRDVVKASSLTDFLKNTDNPVRYPKYGGLKTIKTQEKLGMKFKTWQEMVDMLT